MEARLGCEASSITGINNAKRILSPAKEEARLIDKNFQAQERMVGDVSRLKQLKAVVSLKSEDRTKWDTDDLKLARARANLFW
jgi:hypothetical protein